MGMHPSRRPKAPQGELPKWPRALFHAETGEERVFNSAKEVPEGFITREELESGVGAAPQDPPASDPAESPNKGLAKKLGLTLKQMREDLDAAGIKYAADLKADDLAAVWNAVEWDDDDDSEDDSEDDEDTEDAPEGDSEDEGED